MTAIKIEIPDEKASIIIKDFALYYNYQEKLADGITNNPQTKKQFMIEHIKRYVAETVLAARVAAAQSAAQALLASARASSELDTTGMTGS